MDAVIDFRKIAFDVPAEELLLLLLQPFKFLDQIDLEFRADPHTEFKGDVFVCVGTAISPSTRHESNRVCLFNPFLHAELIAVQTGLTSNYGEFAIIKSQAGLNSYKISVKEWVEKTNAIGIMSKAGRYGGTYAHKDIAFEFGMWISPKFKLLLIKEFERLKAEEQKQLGWNAKRELSKINYRIHTDAIKQNLIPNELTKEQINYVYAEEADVLNMALFGMTAKEWRNKNKNLDGNIRDHATINELICLANLENLNSVFINDGLNQSERLVRLNKIAISQMKILNETDIKYLNSK